MQMTAAPQRKVAIDRCTDQRMKEGDLPGACAHRRDHQVRGARLVEGGKWVADPRSGCRNGQGGTDADDTCRGQKVLGGMRQLGYPRKHDGGVGVRSRQLPGLVSQRDGRRLLQQRPDVQRVAAGVLAQPLPGGGSQVQAQQGPC